MHDRDVSARHGPMLGCGGTRAAADENDQVGGGDRIPRLVGPAIGADHADGQGVIVRNDAMATDRRGDRRIQHFGKSDEFRRCARNDDAAAADESGPLGVEDRTCACCDQIGVGRGAIGRKAGMRGVRPQIAGVERLLLHVIRQSDVRRAGPAGGRGPECCPERMRDLAHFVDHHVPFGQWREERLLIERGEGVAPPRGDRHIRCDREQGDGGFIRFDHAGEDVGRAAAAGALADAHPAAYPRIGVGHVARASLVARENMLHAVIQPGERVIEWQAGVPAQAENMLHAMMLQHAHGRLGTGHSLQGPFSTGGRPAVSGRGIADGPDNRPCGAGPRH